MEPQVASIMDEMEQYRPITYASTGQRFANYIIDVIVYYLLYMVFVFMLGVVSTMLSVDMISIFLSEEPGDKLLVALLGLLVMFCIYFFSEGISKGRTIGKLITGTKAVREDGSPISWGDALKRSLARFIPFEPFSAFSGNGMWHDRLAKTMVIKTRE